MRALLALCLMPLPLLGCMNVPVPLTGPDAEERELIEQEERLAAFERGPASPVEALRPYYRSLDVELPRRPEGLDLPGEGVDIARIAFASCMDQAAPSAAMRAMAAEAPDLVVLTGDNVYGDAYRGDMSLPELRQAYADLAVNPDFLALSAAAPIAAIWDDHDYGMNDGGVSFSGKEFAQRIFNEFWDVPADDPRRQRPGLYFSQMFGEIGREVHVIVLDTRYFRSDLNQSSDPNRRYDPLVEEGATILGEAQWSWLEAELRKPAAVKVLVSSIQVIADGHAFEKWNNIPAERDRLFALIDEIAPEGLIMVSGDRHRAGLYRFDRANRYPIYELTASSLNRPSSLGEEPGPYREGPTFPDPNYGMIEVDWDRRLVTFSIRDEAGTPVLSRSVLLRNMAGG